jgi:hypothetical protein
MLYEITLRAEYAGQQTINRWNYLSSGTPASVSGSFALASAMGFIRAPSTPFYPAGTIFPAIWAIQSTGLSYREVVSKAIYDPVDFYTVPFVHGEAGAAEGVGASPFVALGMRSNRVRTDIDRGTKRFGGVSESVMGSAGVVETGAFTLLQVLADLMGDTLSYDDEGSTITFVPCVVSKLKYTTPSGKFAYKYYDTLSAQTPHIASGVSWEAYSQVRSQTSRQYGKGA